MSFLFGASNPSGSNTPQQKPIIQKVVRPVAKPKPHGAPQPVRKPDLADRFKLSTNPKFQKKAKEHESAKRSPPVERELAAEKKTHLNGVQKAKKRKSASPMPIFNSDSEGESEDDLFSRQVSKKPRKEFMPDRKRKIRDVKNWSESDDRDDFPFIHANQLTRSAIAKYTPIFGGDAEDLPEITLQYPSAPQGEQFSLVAPKSIDEFSPVEEVLRTIKVTLEHYLPTSSSKPLLDNSSGLEFRIKRAWRHLSLHDLQGAISEYNNVVTTARSDGTSAKVLDALPHLPLPLVEHILDQIFARTVSPQVDTLRQYEAFSDNTYGELRPQFVSEIFRETALDSSKVFLDLGSGVGNVVLQAALEIGCASHGIEVMENPCKLARAQAREFPGRCRMWGISVGSVNLLQGDFLEDTRVTGVLQRADIVLVNNQAFTPELNAKLTQLFLDLKEGAKIVSLKSFVPHKWKLEERTRDSVIGVLEVAKKEYWSGCVSWKSEGGDYYITTKDSARINRILDSNRRRR